EALTTNEFFRDVADERKLTAERSDLDWKLTEDEFVKPRLCNLGVFREESSAAVEAVEEAIAILFCVCV
nr:hypothetical protein [Tanacetum cinerariifolium]